MKNMSVSRNDEYDDLLELEKSQKEYSTVKAIAIILAAAIVVSFALIFGSAVVSRLSKLPFARSPVNELPVNNSNLGASASTKSPIGATDSKSLSKADSISLPKTKEKKTDPTTVSLHESKDPPKHDNAMSSKEFPSLSRKTAIPGPKDVEKVGRKVETASASSKGKDSLLDGGDVETFAISHEQSLSSDDYVSWDDDDGEHHDNDLLAPTSTAVDDSFLKETTHTDELALDATKMDSPDSAEHPTLEIEEKASTLHKSLLPESVILPIHPPDDVTAEPITTAPTIAVSSAPAETPIKVSEPEKPTDTQKVVEPEPTKTRLDSEIFDDKFHDTDNGDDEIVDEDDAPKVDERDDSAKSPEAKKPDDGKTRTWGEYLSSLAKGMW